MVSLNSFQEMMSRNGFQGGSVTPNPAEVTLLGSSWLCHAAFGLPLPVLLQFHVLHHPRHAQLDWSARTFSASSPVPRLLQVWGHSSCLFMENWEVYYFNAYFSEREATDFKFLLSKEDRVSCFQVHSLYSWWEMVQIRGLLVNKHPVSDSCSRFQWLIKIHCTV